MGGQGSIEEVLALIRSGPACTCADVATPTGQVAPPIMPGWDGVTIPDLFAERFEVPMLVDNDVNIMAGGEICRGAYGAGHRAHRARHAACQAGPGCSSIASSA